MSVPVSSAMMGAQCFCPQKGMMAEAGELPDWVWPSSCSAACSSAGHCNRNRRHVRMRYGRKANRDPSSPGWGVSPRSTLTLKLEAKTWPLYAEDT